MDYRIRLSKKERLGGQRGRGRKEERKGKRKEERKGERKERTHYLCMLVLSLVMISFPTVSRDRIKVLRTSFL